MIRVRLFLCFAATLSLLACTEDTPQEPSGGDVRDLDVYLEMDYQVASTAPNDYSVTAVPEAGGITVVGAISASNGGYLPSSRAQMTNNEVDLAMSFRDFGGIDVPMRVGYKAFIRPLTPGLYVLNVAHRVQTSDTTIVGTPIVNEPITVP